MPSNKKTTVRTKSKAPTTQPAAVKAAAAGALHDDVGVADEADEPDIDIEPHYEPFGAIRPPPKWNHEKDHRELVSRFGPNEVLDGQSPLGFLGDKLAECYERFNGVLDGALCHYLQLGPRHLDGFEQVLSAEDKIEWLLELVATHSARASYRARFMDDLATCLFFERERSRILRDWLRTTQPPFVYGLVEIADGLMASALALEESLWCEQACGYRGPLLFHRPRA